MSSGGGGGGSPTSVLGGFVKFLLDPTNFEAIVMIFIILMLVGILILYVSCLICSLRGDFDLQVDEETGRPMNKIRFVNPFSSKDKCSRTNKKDVDAGAKYDNIEMNSPA